MAGLVLKELYSKYRVAQKVSHYQMIKKSY